MISRWGEPLLMDFGLARSSVDATLARNYNREALRSPMTAVNLGTEIVFGDEIPADGLSARYLETASYVTKTGMFLGTPAYMSPERVQGAEADVRSDVYSLGVLLFQILTGRLPYRGVFQEVLAAIVHFEAPGLFDLREDIDARLEAICRRAMAKNPGDRFQTAHEMADALLRYLRVMHRSQLPQVQTTKSTLDVPSSPESTGHSTVRGADTTLCFLFGAAFWAI